MSHSSNSLSAVDAATKLRSGELSSRDLTESLLSRIESTNDQLAAFVLVTPDRALADALRADEELSHGIDRGPLHGIPYAHKDIFSTSGIATTCASHTLTDYVPDRDCEVETRFRSAGAVLLGKLNTHEFALGGPMFDLPHPPARNPWKPTHSPGASSSGSGVAVAAGMVPIATGSDTSGSIRMPAFHCGVVGLKPTYGLVSRSGMFPLSFTLDHCGPITRTVGDAAVALQIMASFDLKDAGSVKAPTCNYSEKIGQDLTGIKIGYPRKWHEDVDGIESDIVRMTEEALELLADSGAEVREVQLSDFRNYEVCGRIIMMAEAFMKHERLLRESPEKIGRYTYQRMIAGVAVTATDLQRALRLRWKLMRELNDSVLNEVDAIICAGGLQTAPPLSRFGEDWPPPKDVLGNFSIAFNVTGSPALAVPVCISKSGLPMGVQIAGRHFDEATLLQIGSAIESARMTPCTPLVSD